jgi:ribosome assembly protein SQT1
VNPSSTLAVVGGHGGGVRVVSFAKEKFTLIGGLEGHKEEDSVEAITFVEFGATAGQGVVVTGGTDGKACVWDLSTMKLRATLEHQVCRTLPIYTKLSLIMLSKCRTRFRRYIPTPLRTRI